MYKKIFPAIAVTLLFSFTAFSQVRFSSNGIKLERTLQLIDNLYVDDVSADNLTESAIRAMLHDLDPHSQYLNAEEVKELNEPLQGNFDGIGISFNMMLTDTLYVMEVIAGGPSQKVGLMPGDKILFVNDTLIAGVKMKTNDIIKKLRGPKGTVVNVRVLRRGTPELLDFRIVRDKIPIYSIEASYMIDANTGYIRLSRFGATSTEEFLTAEKELKAQGMKNLILDLTYNGGGILQTAADITDEFLGADKLIVYTEGKHQPRHNLVSTAKGQFETGKLIVMVNESSASASEILSGAVQDWDRAVIVGRRTFGKGLVQRQLPLTDATMVRLTVARYYTPSGRCIQKPYENGNEEEYGKDLIKRFNNGEMLHADSIHFPDSLKYTTLVTKRTVFGGGGIMPDYFVPLDTTSTRLHRILNAQGILNRLSIGEIDNNRKQLLKSYPNAQAFKVNYTVPQKLFDKMKTMAESSSITWDQAEFEKSKKLISVQLKALMARDLYDSSAFYSIINEENEIFRESLIIINDDTRYNDLLQGKNRTKTKN
ncbi:MAG: S41 family peptidase [Dysgonamonadaceae bacterium]|jgi:carboxyl-terminal processing protease|nr:S41 family peptidase [Dysgonamonadaceae bacterium]